MKSINKIVILIIFLIILQQEKINAQIGIVANVIMSTQKEKVFEKATRQDSINGTVIIILRVDEASIKSKAKNNIVALQNKLDQYNTRYKNNQLTDVPMKNDDLIAISRKDEDWPTQYYINELNAYIRFTIQQKQKPVVATASKDSMQTPAVITKKDGER